MVERDYQRSRELGAARRRRRRCREIVLAGKLPAKCMRIGKTTISKADRRRVSERGIRLVCRLHCVIG